MGLVEDLDLNHPPRPLRPGLGSIVEEAAGLRNGLTPQLQHTGDGRRAALRCLYIGSTYEVDHF